MNENPNGGPGSEDSLPLEDVGKLVELLARSGVGEIQVRQGELEITVKAKEAGVYIESAPQAPAPLPEVAREPEVVDGSAELNGDSQAVRSPVVGTFYRAPAPGEEPYVEVGDRIGVGQPLCIVEAMKLMNEIPSDVSGEVVEVLVENAEGVEYDQPLFRIRPE